MMKKLWAILIAAVLIGLLSTAAFAKPKPQRGAQNNSRRPQIDKDTAALLVLGFGGYRDTLPPLGYHDPRDRGRHYGYSQGNHYGWRNQWSRGRPQYPPYRYQARTGFRIQLGDGYLEWWETDHNTYFGYDSDRGQYRNRDRDRDRPRHR